MKLEPFENDMSIGVFFAEGENKGKKSGFVTALEKAAKAIKQNIVS